MDFKLSNRLKVLPPYLFVELDRLKRQARQKGRDIIDLAVGDPDYPPPRFIIDALCKALDEQGVHKYALDLGQPEFRRAIADWYKRRFDVKLNPDTEILPLIGSKEGLAHFPLAFLNNGGYALIPDPCYPPYKGGTLFAGGRPYLMPLRESNAFLPEIKEIPVRIRGKARLLYINYPNNPTSATAEKNFYSEVSDFASKNNIIAISDLAYSEIAYDGYKAQSFLQAKGAMAVGIEFHSLSKTFNMTGWRIGWACGNAKLIAALAKVKSNIDSGIFTAIQKAGTAALTTKNDHVNMMNRLYQERRDTFVDGLNAVGWEVTLPRATFYVWAKVPRGHNSMGLVQLLLKRADIVAAPGVGFGKAGRGFIRFVLTVSKERLKEAADRIGRIL